MGLIKKDKEKTTNQKVGDSKDTSQMKYYLPEANIFEGNDEFILELNIPGIKKEDVDVHLENQFLSVDAKANSNVYSDTKVLYREYRVGHFSRQFKITDAIDVEKIKAEVNNGVLELILPKREKMQPKTIEVQ